MARPGQLKQPEQLYHNDPPEYIQPEPEQEFGIGSIANDDFSKQSLNTNDDILEFINKYAIRNISPDTNLHTSAGYLEGVGNELVSSVQHTQHNAETNAFEILSSDGFPGHLHLEKPPRPFTPVNQTNTSKLRRRSSPRKRFTNLTKVIFR